MAHWRSTLALDEAALKWRALAERQRAYFVQLYHTGRWRRYYSEARSIRPYGESRIAEPFEPGSLGVREVRSGLLLFWLAPVFGGAARGGKADPIRTASIRFRGYMTLV